MRVLRQVNVSLADSWALPAAMTGLGSPAADHAMSYHIDEED